MSTVNGIDIDGTGGSADYEDQVKEVMKKIAANLVSQVLLRAIQNQTKSADKQLTIVPYDKGKAANAGECNALAHPDKSRDAAPKGVRFHLGKEDDPRTPFRDERDETVVGPLGKVAGTGDGSDVHLYFSPNTYGGSSCGSGFYGSQPDEVLFHEMVHALRQMQGLLNAYPTNDSIRNYDTEEEFLAIVVANIYISAKPSTQLRADHHGHSPLRPPLNTSAGFLSNADNLKLMKIYNLTWSAMFQALSVVPKQTAIFNPIRQLIADPYYLGP